MDTATPTSHSPSKSLRGVAVVHQCHGSDLHLTPFPPFAFRYDAVVIGNGLANQVSNPDVEVDITRPDVVIRSQIAVLKEMTSWLKAAHSGNDISFDTGEDQKTARMPPAF